MNVEVLAARFDNLWQECGGSDPVPVWRKLSEHYREPHRHYHDLGHLTQCFRELDIAREHISEFAATEMAIWFHDVIYQYGARDNEARSADYFRAAAAGQMAPEFIDRVCDFIVATQHTGAAGDEATAFVVDIDLSGFGLPWDEYLADSDALREEARSVSDKQYYQGKLRFLTELQTWSSLYQTDYFRNRLEQRAQENITRYTGELRAQGFGEETVAQA